jgi:hypothetical protein
MALNNTLERTFMSTHRPGNKTVQEPASDGNLVKDIFAMTRWMKLTARKQRHAKRVENQAANAAAVALSALFREENKIG